MPKWRKSKFTRIIDVNRTTKFAKVKLSPSNRSKKSFVVTQGKVYFTY